MLRVLVHRYRVIYCQYKSVFWSRYSTQMRREFVLYLLCISQARIAVLFNIVNLWVLLCV